MTNIIQRANRASRRVLRPGQFLFDQWLINLSAVRHPGPARKVIFRTVADVRLGLLFYLEGMAGTSQIWEGEEITTGQPLRAAYLGDARAIRFNAPLYLQHLLFRPETVTVTPVRQFPMLLARQEVKKLEQNVDLVIVDANRWVLWEPRSGRSVITPNWIRMEFVFEPGETWEDIQKRFRSHKNNVKRIHQNGFKYRISHDEADFELFYEHMYIPLIASRYGQYGAIDLKESVRAEFHKGFLFMIDDANDRPVAGQLTYLYRKTMYSISSGILNGDPELHSKGALGAIYYYSIQWCYEHGMERFEMGGCRPFETDGLYQYKQHWGMTPTPDLWGGRSYLFWAPRNDWTATAWLDANPVVSLDDYWHADRIPAAAEPAKNARQAIPVTGGKKAPDAQKVSSRDASKKKPAIVVEKEKAG